MEIWNIDGVAPKEALLLNTLLNTPLDLWNVLLSTENITMWASKAAHKHSLNPLNELTPPLFYPHTDQYTLIYLFSVVLTCWVTLHPWWVKTDIHGANGPTACVHRRQSRVLVHQAGTGTHIHHQRQWTGNPGRDLPGRSIAGHIHVYLALL